MAALTAEQAYEAAHQDYELAYSRAAFSAWGTGRDCSEEMFHGYLRDEIARLHDERVRRGELAPTSAGWGRA